MILTTDIDDFNDFANKLADTIGFPPSCDNSLKFTKKILKKYFPQYDLTQTIKYFEDLGGFCDCEILLNVDE